MNYPKMYFYENLLILKSKKLKKKMYSFFVKLFFIFKQQILKILFSVAKGRNLRGLVFREIHNVSLKIYIEFFVFISKKKSSVTR